MSFANALRTQARLALTTCTARSSVCALRTSLPRYTSPSRLLSTSRHLRDFEVRSHRPGGRPVETHPPCSKLFVGGLPANITEDAVADIFHDFGDVTSVTIGPKGGEFWKAKFAHVQFRNMEDAIATYESLQQEPLVIEGFSVRVGYAQERPKRDAGDRPPNPPSRQLYIGRNGHPDVLKEALEPFRNDIVKTHFMRDRETREFNGKGFITFTSIESATAAYTALQQSSHAQHFYLRYASPA